MTTKPEMIRDLLLSGQAANKKESGNSMVPLIQHRQEHTVSPVDVDKLEVGDIVYAKVKGKMYTHLVSALREDEVQISNNKGHVNGWTKKSNVYGIITHVDGVEIKRALTKVKRRG